MNYLQAHFCAAFAHSVPANITYCYGIAVTIKALPASDSSIGAANGHNSSATSAEAAACA